MYTNCVVCGTRFVPAEALGQWACRMHPGRLDVDYACCGTRPSLHFTAWHGNLPPSAGAMLRPEDKDGCVRVDHTAPGAPVPAWSTRSVAVVTRFDLPREPPAAAIVTRITIKLADVRKVDVSFPAVAEDGSTANVDLDVTDHVRERVDRAYGSAAFQDKVLDKTKRRVALAKAKNDPSLVGMDDVDALAAYWRGAAASEQPEVEVLVVRLAAPARDALTVEHARALSALLDLV